MSINVLSFTLLSEIISTDLLRIMAIIPILLYASYTDIISRRVKDEVWGVTILIGLLLLSYDIIHNDMTEIILSLITSIILVGGLAWIIYKLKIFYGADYKAFVAIAILFPWQPTVGILPLNDILIHMNVMDIFNYQDTNQLLNNLILYASVAIFGLTAFVNTILFSLIYFVWNILHNIKTGEFSVSKPLRSLTAQKVNTSDLENRYGNIIEKPEGKNKITKGYNYVKNGLQGITTDFFKDYKQWYLNNQTVSKDIDLKQIDEIKMDEFIEDMDSWDSTDPQSDKEKVEEILNKDRVWITPGTPFIVPITLGVFSTIIFGNLVYTILMLIL